MNRMSMHYAKAEKMMIDADRMSMPDGLLNEAISKGSSAKGMKSSKSAKLFKEPSAKTGKEKAFSMHHKKAVSFFSWFIVTRTLFSYRNVICNFYSFLTCLSFFISYSLHRHMRRRLHPRRKLQQRMPRLERFLRILPPRVPKRKR